jgi:hypothetical protein
MAAPVLHFVKVTSTGAPPLACVCAPGTPATPDGEVGEKGWPLHAAVKMQMPMAINARLMVATPFNRDLNRPVRYEAQTSGAFPHERMIRRSTLP